MALISLDHAGQNGSGHIHESFYIGVNHGLPIIYIRLLGAGKPEGQAGIVDEDIDGAKLFGKLGNTLLHLYSVADVKDNGMDGDIWMGGLEFIQSFAASAGNDELPAFFGKAITAGKAEAGGSTGN